MASGAIVLDVSLAFLKAESSVNLFTKLINWFSSRAEIRFELYGNDYSHEKVLGGLLYSKEQGTMSELVISGKPAVCKYVLEKLTGNDSDDGMYQVLHDFDRVNLIDVIGKKCEKLKDDSNFSTPEPYKIEWASYFKDLFGEANTLELSFTGEHYEKTRYWIFYSLEKGLKLKVSISGKPEFLKASINHLSIYGPRLIKFLG